MIVAALFSIILFTGYALWVWRQQPGARRADAIWGLVVVALAYVIASPFLSDRAVGTGEAQNYVLALGDALKQFREGHLPFVGQTELAFNGRIHPLRSAPYLFYVGAAIDWATFHQLTAWQIQNLSVALSLALAPLLVYNSLRGLLGTKPREAALLAILVGTCPALLSLTHGFNLLMTTHAVPFFAVGAVAVAATAVRKKFVDDWILAACIAGLWWAHPPLGYWGTLVLGLARGITLTINFDLRTFWNLSAAALFSIIPIQFVLYSVFTSQAEAVNAASSPGMHDLYVKDVMSNISSAFPGSLLWTSKSGENLSDLQPGLSLLVVSLAGGVFSALGSGSRKIKVTAVAYLGMVLLLLAMILPIPGITPTLWRKIPGSLASITNIWPMQRLAIIVAITAVIPMALALRVARPRHAQLAHYILFGGVAWSLLQLWPLVHRGWINRLDEYTTRLITAPNNINLSVTSYAIVQPPPDFSNSVVEAWTKFRRLNSSLQDVAANATAVVERGKVIAEGELIAEDLPEGVKLRSEAVLQPGREYLMTFDFRIPAFPGEIQLRSETVHRTYFLPMSGGPEAFGMNPGNANWITLRTNGKVPEALNIVLAAADGTRPLRGGSVFAHYRLIEVDFAALPIRPDSYLPLRLKVAPGNEAGFIETPRRMIPGYEAKVDGMPAQIQKSPRGNVAISIPAAGGEVTLEYPGPPQLKRSAGLALGSWFLLGGAGLTCFFCFSSPAQRFMYGACCTYLLASALVGISLIAPSSPRTQSLAGTGPILIRAKLDESQSGRSQMLLSSGLTGTGNYAFLEYGVDRRLRVGWEAWGYLVRSDWFPMPREEYLNIVIDATVLNSPVPGPSTPQPSVPNKLRIEVNDRLVLEDNNPAFAVNGDSILIGESVIGGSFAEAKFTGEVADYRRLVKPIESTLPTARFPYRFAATPTENSPALQPLLSFVGKNFGDVLFLKRTRDGKLQLQWSRAEKTIASSSPFRWTPGEQLLFRLERDGADWITTAETAKAALRVTPREPNLPQSFVPALNVSSTGPLRFMGHGFRVLTPTTASKIGPVLLEFTFPKDKTGFAEPLFSAGEAGKADILYVKYVASNQISFGLDHWGHALSESPLIDTNLDEPHTLMLELPVLYPEKHDTRWADWPQAAREEAKRRARLFLDGKLVWEFRTENYPSDQVTFRYGLNQVGASSSQPAFTGKIQSASQIGLGSPQP